MTSLELSLRLPRSAENFHEVPVLIVLKHVVRPVAIGDEYRAIRRDRDGAGFEAIHVFVDIDSRLFGKSNGPHLLAVELELDDLVIGRTGTVKIFHALL